MSLRLILNLTAESIALKHGEQEIPIEGLNVGSREQFRKWLDESQEGQSVLETSAPFYVRDFLANPVGTAFTVYLHASSSMEGATVQTYTDSSLLQEIREELAAR